MPRHLRSIRCNLPYSNRDLFVFQREADVTEENFGFFSALGGSDDGDGDAEDVLRIFVGGLGEYRLLFHAERDVAHFVYRFGRNAAKVLGARQDDMDELLEERGRARAAEGHLVTHQVAHAALEGRDRLLGYARSRSLARDAREPINDEFEALLVLIHLPDACRYHDLHHFRRLHNVGVAEISLHRLKCLTLYCLCIHTIFCSLFTVCYFSSCPLFTATRARLPSLSRVILIRDGLPLLGSTIITLETWSGIARSTIWPFLFCPLARRCFFIILTPSKMTRSSFGNTRAIVPFLPRLFPAITITLSPFLSFIFIRLQVRVNRSFDTRGPPLRAEWGRRRGSLWVLWVLYPCRQ